MFIVLSKTRASALPHVRRKGVVWFLFRRPIANDSAQLFRAMFERKAQKRALHTYPREPGGVSCQRGFVTRVAAKQIIGR